MTSLLVWFAADKKKQGDFLPASVYIATDSLITWKDGSTWLHGKKVFASKTSADIFAYCGDRLFASHALGQVVAAIDAGYLFTEQDSALTRIAKVQQVLRMLWDTFPKQHRDTAHIVHVVRENKEIESSFYCQEHIFEPDAAPCSPSPIKAVSGKASAALIALGTGKSAIESSITEWNRQFKNRHTSRAMFSAFCESLSGETDSHSGGAPQLVGLYRIGNGRNFGVVWKDQRYFEGLKTLQTANKDALPWRNNTFEITDQTTRKRRKGAAAHHAIYDFNGGA